MKKILLSVSLLFVFVLSASSQIMRAEELEVYAKETYGEKWVDAAENLGSKLTLDKNNAITYTQVIQCQGKSAADLYVLLNYWFTSTFNDANSVIKLNDKELGTIIANGFVEGIAGHTGGMNGYVVSIRPVIKVDIKDEKVRVTYTVPFYSVVRLAGGGWLGAIGGTVPSKEDENWVIDKCFPFAAEDKHKKTSSKALVMAHAYSNVIIDKIEEAVKNGMTGTEDNDW